MRRPVPGPADTPPDNVTRDIHFKGRSTMEQHFRPRPAVVPHWIQKLCQSLSPIRMMGVLAMVSKHGFLLPFIGWPTEMPLYR
eukprot:scaffold102959_cov40-Attheya_sp.AAC.1